MKLATLLLLTVVMIVTGCSKTANVNTSQTLPTPKGTATPDPLGFARANYAKHCVECHGGQGDGGVVTVDNHKLKVPSLKEGHALKHSEEDFVDQINEGGDGMPKFKDKLSAPEISDLVRLVRQEFQNK